MRRLALFGLVLLCPLSLRAQPATLPALHWTRAENAQSCIDPRSLARQVEALTGRVLVPASDAQLSIEGSVERRKHGYRARIVATHAGRPSRGQRVLEQPGDDCRALDAALALVIALFIDPELAARGLPPQLLALLPASERAPEQTLLDELTRAAPRPVPPPAPSQPPKVARPPPAAPAERASLRPRGALGLAAQVATKSLPDVARGVTVDGAYRLTAHLAIVLWAQFSRSRQQTEIAGGRSMSAFALSAAPLFCPWFAWGPRWSSAACLGPELGWLRAAPSGFARGREADLSYYTALLRLSAGYGLTRSLAVSAAGLLRVNLAQRSVVYEDLEQRAEAYRLPRLGVGGELGVSYAF